MRTAIIKAQYDPSDPPNSGSIVNLLLNEGFEDVEMPAFVVIDNEDDEDDE